MTYIFTILRLTFNPIIIASNLHHLFIVAMKTNFLIILISILSIQNSLAQEYTQEVRGQVTELHTGFPLPGATVLMTTYPGFVGTSADPEGRFVIQGVPVGRHNLLVSFVGFRPYEINGMLVSSGKEVFLEVRLEESVMAMMEVVVRHKVNKEKPLNEMAVVSARMFTIEETDRYAGSIGDPSRMASNFAGVNTLNDQTNDLVIRGNSPFGLLWLLEGVEIPNPNHFGALGATGGPISMLNNNALNNSDFLTGAFPALYSNALSGVFDLSMRNGNASKYEFVGQLAFNGFEVGLEGPISRENHTSFLANYRYSTLGVLDKIVGLENMALIAVPYYQDLNFKASLYRGKAGRISLFGLLGTSYINISESDREPEEWDHDLVGQEAISRTYNGTAGINHQINFGTRFRWESTLAATHIGTRFSADTLTRDNPLLTPQQRLVNRERTLFLSSRLTWRMSAKNILYTGLSLQPMSGMLNDSLYRTSVSGFLVRNHFQGNYSLGKAYASWRHNVTDQFSLVTGISTMYFDGNKDFSFEPRFGLSWSFGEGQSLSLAAGVHAHLAPRFFYLYELGEGSEQERAVNRNLKMTRSRQVVVGYDRKLSEYSRLKAEVYYQHHSGVPVMPSVPGWSLLNYGSEWIDFITGSDSLVNGGSGNNYGLEFTLEKFLSRGLYYLVTASLYNSRYRGYDGTLRNTAFNGNYIFNALAGKEFMLKSRNFLTFDAKIAWAGGKRILPFSGQQIGPNMWVRVDDWDNAYREKMEDYFRINLRIGYRLNLLRATHEFAVDLYNLTNRRNIFIQNFDSITGETRTLYQFSFLPVLLYRVQF